MVSKAINRISMVETSAYILQVNFKSLDEPDQWCDEWHRMNDTQQYARMSDAFQKVKAIRPSFFVDRRVRIMRVNTVTTLTATKPFESPSPTTTGETK